MSAHTKKRNYSSGQFVVKDAPTGRFLESKISRPNSTCVIEKTRSVADITTTITPQIITENGKPAFAVIPYEQFKSMQERLASYAKPEEVTIPHAIVKATVLEGKTIIKAWREYLGKTQQEVADRAGMKQPQYARYENDPNANPRRTTLSKIATAMGLTIDHFEE